MIQRIQTVYMAVSAALMGVFLFSPLFAINNTNPFKASDCKLGYSFVVAFVILAVVAIFMYRNRRAQIILGWLMVACNLFVIFFYSVHYHFLLKGAPPAHPGDYIAPRPGALIPILTFVFTLLAIANIRKDEKLVRESDRLR